MYLSIPAKIIIITKLSMLSNTYLLIISLAF
jgi:hypothetical protein